MKISIEKLNIFIEKTNISIEKLIISIEKLNILIEKVIISIKKLNILIEKLNISIEKMKKLIVFALVLRPSRPRDLPQTIFVQIFRPTVTLVVTT